VWFVGVTQGVELSGEGLFVSHVHLRGGPRLCAATCRTGPTHPGQPDRPGQGVRSVPPQQRVAEGYRVMDQHRAIKVLCGP
jgi:hypothetical protein